MISISEEEDEDNTDRIEMLWNSRIEMLFRHWATECKDLSKTHNVMAKRKKCIHRSLGIPAIIVPLIMASFMQVYNEEHMLSPYVNSIGYLLSGTLTGISTFINYSGQYEKHYFSEVRYRELYTDIQSILIKPKKDRLPADVCIEQLKLRFQHINEYAPDI
jgi:hypothetical protein